MWSANWWWDMQWVPSKVNKYATIVPLIIASDKTCLSTLSGGQQAYPAYLPIGNISKATQRKAKERATVLIGYLPVNTFEDIKNMDTRACLRADMTHHAMEELMAPLKTALEHSQPKGEDTDKVDKDIVQIDEDKDEEIYKRKDEDELKDVELEVIEDKVVEGKLDA
ncbi:hypothetical protein FRC07_004396 [Ceratobasidium sp. 392]|nr:hypothetical protein FRC07_004396 [Ceratobasidium sp. 392]